MPRKSAAAVKPAEPETRIAELAPDPFTLDHTSEFAPFMAVLPLSALRLSGLNVRQTERDADVASLAEDIAARGLKQNLTVIPAHFMSALAEDGDSTNFAGLFEVSGGGRRTQAMKLLAADGRLPADHPVPCLIEPRAAARETSLSENLHRVAMNPADEFEAFDAIARERRVRHGDSEDQAIAYTARRFGVAEKHVRGRLRLAGLAPEILEALRKNAIGLDSAKAYAGSEDHELQVKVFEAQAKSTWRPHDPQEIRRALRGETLALDDTLVLWTGLDAYRAAGGRTEVEMFMGSEGEERLLDVALLQKLAREKAEKLLPVCARFDGWKDALLAGGARINAWPKEPEGFSRKWDYGEALADLDPEDRARSIAVVSVDLADVEDGEEPCAELTIMGRFVEAKDRDAPLGYVAPSPEERAAIERENRIALWQARLAVGPFAGTPLEGQAFWPGRNWASSIDWEWPPEREDDDTDADGEIEPVAAIVAVQIRVTGDQLKTMRADAEAKVAALEAEEAERAEAAKQAAGPEDEEDPDVNDIDKDDVEDELEVED